MCQLLRIISFTVTQLPAPNYHCRGGEPTAIREMPAAWWGHVTVDLKRQVRPVQAMRRQILRAWPCICCWDSHARSALCFLRNARHATALPARMGHSGLSAGRLSGGLGVLGQATHGCGDLIFSSHTIFALMGSLTYQEYGTHVATKVASHLSYCPHTHSVIPSAELSTASTLCLSACPAAVALDYSHSSVPMHSAADWVPATLHICGMPLPCP